MSDADALKLQRNGQLTFGKRIEPRRPKPGTMLWQIERDADGTPVRMYWMGMVPPEAVPAA